ncbi:hypothetical protein PYCC9005_001418 [Savitreella phatthalungensis]
MSSENSRGQSAVQKASPGKQRYEQTTASKIPPRPHRNIASQVDVTIDGSPQLRPHVHLNRRQGQLRAAADVVSGYLSGSSDSSSISSLLNQQVILLPRSPPHTQMLMSTPQPSHDVDLVSTRKREASETKASATPIAEKPSAVERPAWSTLDAPVRLAVETDEVRAARMNSNLLMLPEKSVDERRLQSSVDTGQSSERPRLLEFNNGLQRHGKQASQWDRVPSVTGHDTRAEAPRSAVVEHQSQVSDGLFSREEPGNHRNNRSSVKLPSWTVFNNRHRASVVPEAKLHQPKLWHDPKDDTEVQWYARGGRSKGFDKSEDW